MGGEKQAFLTRLAVATDERKAQAGEFAADHSPGWAVTALGPVPDDPLDRLEWEARASHLSAYRELYGWSHEAEPIGPEPTGDSPDKRAAWHAAYGAMTRTDEAAMSSYPDGSLHHKRATYEAETGWASAYAGDELRQVRIALQSASTAINRADAEAEAALGRRG